MSGPRARRLRLSGAALTLLATATLLAGCGGGAPTLSASSSHAHHHGPPTTSALGKQLSAAAAALAKSTPVPPAGSSFVANLHVAVPGSPSPGAPSNISVPATWYGYPSALPVIATAPGWLEVRLAQRPNESTTWIPQSAVTLTTTPFVITVNLATMHVTVTNAGKQIFDFPAGTGTPDDPTPTGQFFIAMKVPPPSPGYGPFVLATSDHSNTITDWEDSGDAIIAIHGPITSADDAAIGSTGAAISHGCIRLHDNDLAFLANIPAGTPVNVVSS